MNYKQRPTEEIFLFYFYIPGKNDLFNYFRNKNRAREFLSLFNSLPTKPILIPPI